MEIAFKLEYLKKADFDELYGSSREIERMLSSLSRKLNSKQAK
jgi:hypothetical protein